MLADLCWHHSHRHTNSAVQSLVTPGTLLYVSLLSLPALRSSSLFQSVFFAFIELISSKGGWERNTTELDVIGTQSILYCILNSIFLRFLPPLSLLSDTSRYSRNGREVQLLLNLARSLPSIFIDGEFWYILSLIYNYMFDSPPLTYSPFSFCIISNF